MGNNFWNLETPVFMLCVFITDIYLRKIWHDNWRFIFENLFCKLLQLLFYFLVVSTWIGDNHFISCNIFVSCNVSYLFDFTDWKIHKSRYLADRSNDMIAIKAKIEKSRSGKFLWNRNWDLGWLAILKKKLGQLWAIFEASFFMFSWAK